jgi:hypothetical protein
METLVPIPAIKKTLIKNPKAQSNNPLREAMNLLVLKGFLFVFFDCLQRFSNLLKALSDNS